MSDEAFEELAQTLKDARNNLYTVSGSALLAGSETLPWEKS